MDFLFCTKPSKVPKLQNRPTLGGGGGHSPGHVTVWSRPVSPYEDDLPGVLQGDGTGVKTVVLQVKLSSTCTLSPTLLL